MPAAAMNAASVQYERAAGRHAARRVADEPDDLGLRVDRERLAHEQDAVGAVRVAEQRRELGLDSGLAGQRAALE